MGLVGGGDQRGGARPPVVDLGADPPGEAEAS